jgi:hypothetical protein
MPGLRSEGALFPEGRGLGVGEVKAIKAIKAKVKNEWI